MLLCVFLISLCFNYGYFNQFNYQKSNALKLFGIKCLLIWRPLSLSELIPMVFNKGFTHLGSEASIYIHNYLDNIFDPSR